jgi:hypothetical protein
MNWFHAIVLLALVLCMNASLPQATAAQATPADTAAVLLSTANALDRDGKHDVAEELLRFIVRRYPQSPAAVEARRLLTGVREARELGAGRTGFVIWNTIFTSWLGVAIPAAFGADDTAPYGAGLLIGAPLGFFGSSAYARRHPLTAGQGALYQLSTVWLSWQAAGWREVLDIGDECEVNPWGEYCYAPDTAPWVALTIGGLAGVGTGLLLTKWDVEDGTAALMRHGAFWGTWYGVGLGVLADAEDDALLTWTLMGGNVAIAGAVPMARAWGPSPGKVRLVTAAGLAGGLVGGGIDLLLEVDDEKAAIGIPLLGTTVGLIAGVALVSGRRDAEQGGNVELQSALLDISGGLRVGLPTPYPSTRPALSRDGRIRQRPAVDVQLFALSF